MADIDVEKLIKDIRHLKKLQHIGSVDNNCEVVEQAYQSWENRQLLETIEKALETIEEIVSEVIADEQILTRTRKDRISS